MKKLAIVISSLLFLICISASDPALAFQDGGGKPTKPKTAPTPKPPADPNKGVKRNTTPPTPKTSTSAQVTIKTSLEGCTISIDSISRGKTDQDGLLNISKLKTGMQALVVTKAGYQKHESIIEVNAGPNPVVEVTLTPLPVSLAINPNVSGSRVEVNGQSFQDFADLRLMPGTYRIKVSRPGYRSVTREIELHPAKPEVLAVTMEPVSVEQLLSQAERAFNAQQYDQVIAVCLDLLPARPDHPRALLLLGQSYFSLSKYEDSVFYLVKAVRLGEQVTLPAKHHHSTLTKGDDLCSGQFVIRKDSLEFRAAGNDHSFSVPWPKVYELSVESYRNAPRLHTRMGVLKGKKEDKQNFNFFASQSDLHRSNPNLATSTEVNCQDCRVTVDAIYQVLQQLRK